jgi:DNA-binding HxlR family transcriptional regulator
VEYTLTEKGMSLNDVMQLLAEWGKKNVVAE